MTVKAETILVVGDDAVGKTAIIYRYIEDVFKERYDPPTDNYPANIELAAGRTVEVEIIDTAVRGDFRVIRDIFMDTADIFLVVYSMNEFQSLLMAENLLKDISVLRGRDAFKLVLVGNKCDLGREVAKVEATVLAHRFRASFIETSAKSGAGIKELFQEIGRLIKKNRGEIETRHSRGGCCNVA